MPRGVASLLALPCAVLIAADVAPPARSAGAAPEIKVAPGFEVVRIHTVPRESGGSWVSLAADDRGRLYASDQYGPLHQITLPRARDGAPVITPLELPVGGAHGLTWINGSLYAVVGQKAVRPTGLYRIRSTPAGGGRQWLT